MRKKTRFYVTVLMKRTTSYPVKPIKIVVGFSPGAPLDTHARVLIDQLQKHLGQPVIVDYKPGAGGSIGANEVIKSPADSYTLLIANTGTMVINPLCTPKIFTTRYAISHPSRAPRSNRWRWWCTMTSPPRIWRSSSPRRRSIRPKSMTARPATAAFRIWFRRCSKAPPTSR